MQKVLKIREKLKHSQRNDRRRLNHRNNSYGVPGTIQTNNT